MKINIVFVDDEPDILAGYKRVLFNMRTVWTMHFALGGRQALEIIENNPIDVVVTDMRMPEMDGNQLLQAIKDKYSYILRIILSGQQDEVKAIKATDSAHQFLSKPCNIDVLKYIIERAFLLRNYIKDDSFVKLITGIGELPTLPDIYLKLEDELKKNEVSLENVAKIITLDPPLVAKILQTVNSGFFGLPFRITNVIQALSYLGINTIKALIVHSYSFSPQTIPNNKQKYLEQISRHSFKVAGLAKQLAKRLQLGKSIIDDSFIAGILHDIGKLVMMKTPDYPQRELALAEEKKILFSEAEMQMFGFSHAEAGGYLLGIWGLPENVVESIVLHHLTDPIFKDDFTLLLVLHLANEFSIFPDKNIKVLEMDFNSSEEPDEFDFTKYFPTIHFDYVNKMISKEKFIDLVEQTFFNN